MTSCRRQGRKMSRALGVTGANAVWCFILLALIKDGCQADSDPGLEILPSQAVQSKAVGSKLLLTCRPNVADTGLITDLQWRDNNNRTITEARGGHRPAMYTELMPEGMSLALFISSLTEAMAGTYHCSASYANTERLYANVTIGTIIAITWKDAPLNQYPIKGQDYKVKCDVSARPPPTVDWSRNGEQLLTSGRYVLDAKGLLIKNVDESDDGTYTCRAAVMLTGELAERNIKLEVHTPPSMEPMPEVVEVLEGETTSITCQAKGKPPPVYSWTKVNTQQDLSKADRFTVNQHTGILTMSRVDQSDIGPFKCVASNKAGNAEVNVKIEVLVKPKIYELLNVTSSTKKETRLICKASGRPAPTITFKKFGVANNYFVKGPQPDDDRIIVDQDVNPDKSETIGILTILNTQRSDDGLYECMASNKGDKAYKNGHITVEFPPSFEASVNQPPVWTWDMNPANLSCLAESIPNATIEWRLNNVPLLEDSNVKIFGSGPSSYLYVTPRDRRYYTVYRCVATNKWGRAEHNVELRLATIPGSVLQSKLEKITATSITYSLIGPGENFGLPIKAYVVQYKDERNYDWNHAKNKTWSVDSPYIIENLAPMSTYNFRFAALNDVGLGPFGAPQIYTLPKRSSPEPPRLLLGTASETGAVPSPYADHFELRWKIPADNGEPIDVYELIYCPVHKVNGEWTEISESQCMKEEMKAYENTAYEMNNLDADTYYRIRLRAHNIIGYSSPGEMYMKTARGKWNEEEGDQVKKAGFYNVYYSHDTTSGVANAKHSAPLMPVVLSLYLYLCYVR